MSDIVNPDVPSVRPEKSAGTMLKEAREAAGLHIGALAVALKVPVRKLEALEADRLDDLPDAVFCRALAASVCRTLKLDSGPILERLPVTTAPRLTAARDDRHATFRMPSDMQATGWLQWFAKPGGMAVVVLLAGALALALWPSGDRVSTTSSSTPASTVETAPAAAGTAVATATDTVSPTAKVAVPDASASAAVAGVQRPADASSASLGALPAAPAVTPRPAPTSAAATTTTSSAIAVEPGVLVLKARATSWVRVTDAQGVVQVSKTMEPGESLAVTGALPLSAVVGRADATEVLVRGKVLDAVAMSKDNVARFEVK